MGMLNHRVVLFGAPIHGVELAGLLFADYIRSSLFQMDVAEALSDVNGWMAFFRSGFNPSTLLHFYSRLISERLLFRLLECGVSAACTFSGTDLGKDALAFHYTYKIVRDYRYGRLWCTRLIRAVGRFVTLGFLRRSGRGGAGVDGGGKDSSHSSTPPLARGLTRGAGSASPARSFSAADVVDPEVAFYRAPPRPSRTKPFDGMPESCQSALRYFQYCYQTRPYYTTFVSGIIPDVTLFLTEQVMWYTFFVQERTKQTSRWRMLKPFFADLAVVSVQSALVYAARVAGVLIGQRVSQEPTGGGIFWGEQLTLLALLPVIQFASLAAGHAVRNALERRHPRTVEDEMEDVRVAEEAEEAARAEAATAHAAFAFTSVPLGGGGTGASAGHTAGGGGGAGHASASGAANHGPNHYEVLGVAEQSKAPEIKKAYRAMALRNHPDRVGKEAGAQEQARQQMSVINEAYDTLMDPDKRAQYDATRRLGEASDLFKRLESMTTVQLAAVATAAVVGLGTLTVASAYGQYLMLFQRVTSLGRGPLMMFS